MFRIEKIQPYNELFFKNCFYNALFSVMRFYNLEFISILMNQKIYYRYDESSLEFGVNYEDKEDSDEVLLRIGLRKENVNCGYNDIIKEIKQGNPLICGIDWYYIPYQKDTYMKKHKHHIVVIIGYDEDTDELIIYDQNRTEVLNYKEFTIDKEIFIQSVNWCNKYKIIPENVMGNEKNLKRTIESYVKQNYSNENLYKNRIRVIQNIKDELVHIISISRIIDKVSNESIMQGVNEIINNKAIEQLIASSIFQENDSVIDIIGQTVLKWKEVRNRVYKCILRRSVKDLDLTEITKCLLEIINLEQSISDIGEMNYAGVNV